MKLYLYQFTSAVGALVATVVLTIAACAPAPSVITLVPTIAA